MFGKGVIEVLAAMEGITPEEKLAKLSEKEKQMEKAKDCEITFLNKKTYEFNHEDLLVALEKTKDMGVWAMKTPWGIFQPMDAEMYDNVKDAVMGDHEVFPDSSQEDLQ